MEFIKILQSPDLVYVNWIHTIFQCESDSHSMTGKSKTWHLLFWREPTLQLGRPQIEDRLILAKCKNLYRDWIYAKTNNTIKFSTLFCANWHLTQVTFSYCHLGWGTSTKLIFLANFFVCFSLLPKSWFHALDLPVLGISRVI